MSLLFHQKNKADLCDIPLYVLKKINFTFVDVITEALKASILIK